MAPNYECCKSAGNNALLQGMASLLKSQKFADLVVILGDRRWSLHKTVVCARSDFFAKALEGDFKEAQSGSIELHDDDPDIIDKMFYYIYHGEYNDADTSVPAMLVNVRMVAASEKYFVDHLPGIATSKLDYYTERDNGWATEGFADAIEETYKTTVDSGRLLRDTLLEVVMKHKSDLFNDKRMEFSYFQAMAARTPGFSVEVAARLSTAPSIKLYRCPGDDCRAVFACTLQEGETVRRDCVCCGFDGVNLEWTYEQWQEYAIEGVPYYHATLMVC